MLQDFGIISSRPRGGDHNESSRSRPRARGLPFLADPLNAHAVVIIDEAQHLRADVLRSKSACLSNVDEPGGTMLQIVLAGQQDLESLLSRPELRQFQQRISRRDSARAASRKTSCGRTSIIGSRLAAPPEPACRAPTNSPRALGDWESERGGATFTSDASASHLAPVGRPAARGQSAVRSVARSRVRQATANHRRRPC